MEKYPQSISILHGCPDPFSLFGRRGTGFKIPLFFWERDLG